MPPLPNPAHEKFAQLLAQGKTKREAYVIAGYSENDSNCSQLSQRPHIAARVTELNGLAAKRAEVSQARILTELARIGFADITELVSITKRGKVKVRSTDEIPPDLKAAIANISQTRDGIAVKFHDKVAALEKLGKHLGMFKENVDLNVNVSLADLVNGSYELDKAPAVIEGEAKPVDDAGG